MKLKKISGIMLSVMAASIFVGCGTAQQSATQGQSNGNAPAAAKKITVGVALPDFSDKWLSYLQDAMKNYAKTQPDVDVTYVDSQNDANKQMSQIETFIAQKVNAIVLLPDDPVSAPDLVAKANKAHIPIVVVNRSFDGVDKADAYVGGDSLQSGILEAEPIAKLLNGKGNVAIMEGQMGQEAQIKRTEGFKEVLKKYPGINVVLEGTASWDRAKGMALMENWLNSGKNIDAVLSNNDEMAIGAIQAIKAAGKMDKIIVGGIDATPDALGFIKSGEEKVTVFQDANGQGKGALEDAVKLAKGKKIEKTTLIPYQQVTKDNVEEYVKKWQSK